MDEVEALARAYRREMGLDPDAIVHAPAQHFYPHPEPGPHGYTSLHIMASDSLQWHKYAAEARKRLDDAAWSRAMEAVKRDAG